MSSVSLNRCLSSCSTLILNAAMLSLQLIDTPVIDGQWMPWDELSYFGKMPGKCQLSLGLHGPAISLYIKWQKSYQASFNQPLYQPSMCDVFISSTSVSAFHVWYVHFIFSPPTVTVQEASTSSYLSIHTPPPIPGIMLVFVGSEIPKACGGNISPWPLFTLCWTLTPWHPNIPLQMWSSSTGRAHPSGFCVWRGEGVTAA